MSLPRTMLILPVLVLLVHYVSSHVGVSPYLNPAGVSYVQPSVYSHQSSYPYSYPASYGTVGYDAYPGYHQQYYGGIQYAPAQVKATVHHVPAVADVPVTNIHAQPAVLQKDIAVARPAIKTRIFEIRRPAIQKHFFDVEERTLVRPVGSALLELEEPSSRVQKGPAVITAVEHNAVPVVKSPVFAPVATVSPSYPLSRNIAPYPVPVSYAPSVYSAYQDLREDYLQGHYQSSTPLPYLSTTCTPSVLATSPRTALASEDSVIVDSAHVQNGLAVETHSHGDIPIHQGNANQLKYLDLITARGHITEYGLDAAAHSEFVGDAGLTRARVLSATPAPHHEPVHEEVKTRRIVVSRPAHTLQEVNVVEPATKLEHVTINQPTVVKTASVGLQRIHTSYPVVAKSYTPGYAYDPYHSLY